MINAPELLRLILTPAHPATAGGQDRADVVDYDFGESVALYGQAPQPRYVLTARQGSTAGTQVAIDYDVPSAAGRSPRSLQVNVPAGTTATTHFTLDLGADAGPAARLRRLSEATGGTGQLADRWELTAVLGQVTALAARSMAARLTLPFAPGADSLPLWLAGGDAQQATFADYNFDDHLGQFSSYPDPDAGCPRYVLLARRDVPAATQLTLSYRLPGASAVKQVSISVPAATPAGASFMLDLGGDEGQFATTGDGSGRRRYTQLTALSADVAVAHGRLADTWTVTALLGNLAKLLWVLGGERDAIRRELVRVQAQRRLANAAGRSLDLLGQDYGVPRFPPRPYGFEAGTVALYHFDDGSGTDVMRLYGGAGHDATADALVLALSGTDTAAAPIAAYDFSRHLTLYGSLPAAPIYRLVALQYLRAASTVTVDYDPTGGTATTSSAQPITVPAGTRPGTAFTIDLGADGGPTLRLTQVRVQGGPDPPPAVADAWQVLAVLGDVPDQAAGRFGNGLAFRSADPVLWIEDHADFTLAAADSFTVECFVQPDAPQAGARPWHLVSRHPDPTNAALPGWVLSVGEFGRGIPANARFLVADGNAAHAVTLFADVAMTEPRFYHVAGVIDRTAHQVRLYVDGTLRASQPTDPPTDNPLIGSLGAPNQAMRIQVGRPQAAAGSPSPAYGGVIDELRLSRAARSLFYPVLGESDDSYRGRLRLFERWTLPSPPNLERLLNEAVGPIKGDPAALQISEANGRLVGGSLALRVQPIALRAGECIDATGNRHAREADVCGQAADEQTFDPVFLVYNDDPRLQYAPMPMILRRGQAPANPHRMQLAIERPLNVLLDHLGAQTGLRIESAFDPGAPDLRAVARAVLLTHAGLTLGQLAVQAHLAGFGFVCVRSDLHAVYASAPPSDYLELETVSGGAAANGFDLSVGQTLALQIRPKMPRDALCRWITIPCGGGRVSFDPATADQANVSVRATAAGRLALKVEAVVRQRTAAGARALRIGPADLPDNQSIGADGTLGVAASIADGPADAFFDPAYLATHADNPAATFGANVNLRRMHPAVVAPFDRLLGFVAAARATLAVTQAYVPGDSGLAGGGRLLQVNAPAFTAGRLAVLAHGAGFTYVRSLGNHAVELRQAPGDLLTVTVDGPALVAEQQSIPVSLAPRAQPHGVCAINAKVYVACTGTDLVCELDRAAGMVNRVFKVGWGPVAVAVSADGARLFSADQHGNTVTTITIATGALIKQPSVPGSLVALAHSPTQARLYVACQGPNAVLALDSATTTITFNRGLTASPTAVAVTPNGLQVWVLLGEAMQVAIFDASLNPVATVNLAVAAKSIAIAPDGSRAYVSTTPDPGVIVIDVATRTAQPVVALGTQPATSDAVAVAVDGSTVFVVDAGQGQLHLLAPLPAAPFLKERGAVHVGLDPAAVAADVQQVYVVNAGSDDVSVVGAASRPPDLLNNWRLGTGLGERLTWTAHLGGAAGVTLSTTAAPALRVGGTSAGPVQLRATYALPGGLDPYTFAVVVKPALLDAHPDLTISKEQYDLLMNVLSTFCPLGVEVITRAVRERVVELRQGLLDALPDYTFPNFRTTSPTLKRPERSD